MLKIRSIPLLILSLFSVAYAQKATFKEIKLKPNPKTYAPEGASIIYPIIVTANPQADKLMNTVVKDEMLDLDQTKHSARALLLEHINEYGLINLSYEVTYNKNNMLSMYVYAEGCGAYCSSGNTYFNFDLKTGKAIRISDLIVRNKLDSFQNIVFQDKLKALQQYKVEEIEALKQEYIDSSSYTWIMEEVDSNCSRSANLENFSILSNAIQVFDICEFPHAIRSQEPSYDLKYEFRSLQALLIPKFKSIFLK